MAPSRLILAAAGLALSMADAPACGPFYAQAPPTLDYYLQRLPAKSIEDLLGESKPAPQLTKDPVLDESEVEADFASGPSPQLVQKMDALLAKLRQNYTGPDDDNLLQDFRDLAAGNGSAAEILDYIKWRFTSRDLFVPADPNQFPPPKPSDNTDAIDGPSAKASPALMPHWIYLKGAYLYDMGNPKEAESFFDRVLTDHPHSPRAEASLFMKARCEVAESPGDNSFYVSPAANPQVATALSSARETFEQYLKQYPHGHYRIDALGWLGGVAYRSGDAVLAMTYYIQQTEAADHPEDYQAAVVMLEKCLSGLPDNDPKYLDQLAEHPTLALALTYAMINGATPEGPDGDESDATPNSAQMKDARQKVLPKLAAAVLAHKRLYQGVAGREKYLAILAHAASDEGRQDQALELVRMAGFAENDDLAFVHALALQRAGKYDDAIAAYQHFLEKFAKSTLSEGAHYRLGLALHDAKRDGDALLELASLNQNRLPVRFPSDKAPLPGSQAPDNDVAENQPPAPTSSYLDIDYSGASDSAIVQTMDALLNFAPIDSLATALAGKDPEHEQFRHDLRTVLKERCLAREDFVGALRYSDPADTTKNYEDLQERSERLRVVLGAEAAKEDWKIADYWVKETKLPLASPLDNVETRTFVFADEMVAGLQRQVNGRALNYVDPDSELEGRNPYQHASSWWTRTAAADHAGPLAPVALWKVIDAQQKIAATSPYTLKRAMDTNQAAQSRKLYDGLRSQYPDSREAKDKAVYWTFPNKDDMSKTAVDNGIQEMAFTGIEPITIMRDGGNEWRVALGMKQDWQYQKRSDWDVLCNDVAKFPTASAGMDAKAFAGAVDSLLATARPLAMTMDRMYVVNSLEDLKSLGQVPNLDPQTRNAYVAYRIDQIGRATDADTFNSDLQPRQPSTAAIDDLRKLPGATAIAAFIDYLPLALASNTDVSFTAKGTAPNATYTFDDRDYVRLAKDADAYLKQYPSGPKCEAAAILRLRAVVFLARPKLIRDEVDWPETDAWAGADFRDVGGQGEFDAAAFNSALQSYQQEFPNSQYPDTITSIRADADILQNKWGDALDCLVALHDPAAKPAFQDQVALDLSKIFNDLMDEDKRHQILAAILTRPAARDLLKTYLKVGGVPYLRQYLNDQLAVASR